MEETLSLGLGNLSLKEKNYMTPSSTDQRSEYDSVINQIRNWIESSKTQHTPIASKEISVLKENTSPNLDISVDAELSNSRRIQLLARKYINETLSYEEEARFEIESERVRSLMPMVTSKDVKNLADSLKDLKKSQKKHNKIRKYLEMD